MPSTATDPANMTEQEIARACADIMYENDQASQFLGINLVDIAPGQATMSMEIKPYMLNGHENCHGGFIFSLADSCFAFACNSRNNICVGQSVSIDYLSPGKLGEVLTASAVELKHGGRTGLYEITVNAPNGSAVAHFRGRSYRLQGQHI